MPADSDRFVLLDAFRFIAAVGVVWIHAVDDPTLTPTKEIGRFAVPFFLFASLLLMGETLRRRDVPWRQYAIKRIGLLYGAFLIWNAIYLIARLVKHRLVADGQAIEWGPSLLYAGTALQLWFLPYLLGVSLIVHPMLRWAAARPSRADLLALLFIALSIAATFLPYPPVKWGVSTTHFIDCAYYALPATLLAVAVAAVFPSIRPVLENSVATLIGLALWIGATVLILTGGRSAGWEMAAGFGALIIAVNPARGALIRSLAGLGAYAMGVYLAHVLWVEFLQAVAGRGGWQSSAQRSIATAIVATLLSLAVSRVLKKTPLVPR